MSKFNYEDLHLTYFLEGMAGWFQDELEQAIAIAAHSVDVYCKIAITNTISELSDATNNQAGRSISLRGFYCVFIFKTDEDRSMFKLSVPNNADLRKRVIDTLHD